MDFIVEIFQDYTLRTVVLGTLVLGLASGALGTFAVLRQQSLLGDAISHATLPGICLMFLFTESKNSVLLLFGAVLAGWIGTLLMMLITENTTIKRDAALGIILSVFFGVGLTLLTYIQKLPLGTQAGLNTFLFGNASTLLQEDVILISIVALIAFMFLAIFWKEFKVMTFDPDFAVTMGFPYKRLDILLTTLIVLSIVIGLQTVGVVLMSAMIIAPATAARQWTDRLGVMVFLSGFFGAISGIIGALISSKVAQFPTGPSIVLVVSFLAIFSLLIAPNRGLIFSWFRTQRNRAQIQGEMMLANLLLFSESQTDPFHAHDIAALIAIGKGGFTHSLKNLEKKGYVYSPEKDFWGLTQSGLDYAKSLSLINGDT